MATNERGSRRLSLPRNHWQLPYRYDRWTFDPTQSRMVVVCVPRRWHPRWWLWQINATIATTIQMLSGERFKASWLVPQDDEEHG